jgi:hypothetical protein
MVPKWTFVDEQAREGLSDKVYERTTTALVEFEVKGQEVKRGLHRLFASSS